MFTTPPSVLYPPSIHSCVLRGSSCHTGTLSPTNHPNLPPPQDRDDLRFDEFRLTSGSDSVHSPPSIHSRVSKGSSCHAGTVSPVSLETKLVLLMPQNIYRWVSRHCHCHCCVVVIILVIVHCPRHRHSLVGCCVIGGMDTSSPSSSSSY